MERIRIFDICGDVRESLKIVLGNAVRRNQIEDAKMLPGLVGDVVINHLENVIEAIVGYGGMRGYRPSIYDSVSDLVGGFDGDEIEDYLKEIGAIMRRDDTHPVARIVKETSINLCEDGVAELWNIDNDVLLTEVIYGLCPAEGLLDDIGLTLVADIRPGLPTDAEIYSVQIQNRKITVSYGYS